MSFQEQGFPDDRKKLDGFRLLDPVSPQDAPHSETETKSTFDIRKSLAWDSAFFTSPGVLEPEELLQTTSSEATGNAVNLLGSEEEILLPSESLEPEKTRKSVSYSYRKSLAWDNAFYTSPGVLDPEELSIVNKGFKKSESHQLPAINDVWRSTESNSTIDNGSTPLASLEFELFEDTRSPMQKQASLKLKKGRGLQNVHFSKKIDVSSRVRMKPLEFQRQNLDARPEWMSNKIFVSSKRQLAAGGGKPTASLKQPRIFSGLNPSATAATKRSSLGLNCVKMGAAKAGAGQCSTVSTKPCFRASSSIILQSSTSTPSPKSSSSGSLAAKDTPSDSIMNSRRKVDCSFDNFAANGLTIINPIGFTKTNKDDLESSCQDHCDIFTPKSTGYASSATSLDGWSSESSSSSSMSQRAISRQSPFGSRASQALDTVHCIGLENQETSLPNQHMKPSGLRVPSPKNGFFDEEVALVRGRGSSMPFQSVVPSIVSQNAGANRHGKLKPPRNVDGKKNVQKALKRQNKECTKENKDPNTQCPGENICIGQDNSDKENAYYFQNQIEGITKQVGIIDLGCDVLMELISVPNLPSTIF